LNCKPQENNSKTSSCMLDIAHCSSAKVLPRFGGTYHLHLQGRKVKVKIGPVLD
jgi:hypothetical protein